ncbi:MAG: HPr family phosphocarrier protein [Clostridia bacterium]|nr:HPr family phosphocarrier protein [Clostridia bacterium]MEE1023911.1 HPr family phosphocarrier protein [Acutalibacteraceae bacterium]
MKQFNYTIKDEVGIHARPAGMLAKTAKGFQSEILIEKDGKSVNATKLMMLMGMGIKCGDTVTVTITGEDEEAACSAMQDFFAANL